MDFLEGAWTHPDDGIWEIRGPRQHFTHSKVMAWVAADRAVKAVEQCGLDGPTDRWRRLRADIHSQVCDRGYDNDGQTFTQTYGRRQLDASLLLIPLVGFLPANDQRVTGTVAAIERHLCDDGFVRRYTADGIDGLPGGEGVFLPCSFWLADNLLLQGRHAEGQALFDRLTGLANDVGLLAEEYDPTRKRMVRNFPQAFTHVALIDTPTTCRSPRVRHEHGPKEPKEPRHASPDRATGARPARSVLYERGAEAPGRCPPRLPPRGVLFGLDQPTASRPGGTG